MAQLLVMRYSLLLVLFFFFLSVAAQTKSGQSHTGQGILEGSVFDASNKGAITGVSVRLLSVKDSILIKGTFSDDNGHFSMVSSYGKYFLRFSFLGYKDRYVVLDINKSNFHLRMDSVFLKEDAKLLNDITVEADMPNIVLKGDTVEFNANAYLLDDNDLLKDLISNIPGAEIDENGKIKINGKTVNKILVDGKEFFGSDIKSAIDNLPAKMIKKLQLYNKNSEISKITGIRDMTENPVLDLIVKDEFRMTLYGNASGGYGTDNRYNVNTFLNNMGKNTNSTLIGNFNNINSGTGGSGAFSVNPGETEQKSIGLNIVHQPSDKLNIEGNISYDKQDGVVKSREESRTFLDESGDRFGLNSSSSENNARNYTADFNFRWNFDSLSVIDFNSSNSFMKLKENTHSYESSYIITDSLTTGNSHQNNVNDNFSTYNRLSFARNLGKAGRSLDATLNFLINNDDTNGTNYSATQYPTLAEDIIDQRIKIKNNNSSFSFSTSYNEPVGKNLILSLAYNINVSNASRNNDTRKKDMNDPLAEGYTVIDSAYSRNTKNNYLKQDIRLSLQSKDYDARWFYSFSFGLNPAVNKNRVMLMDSLIENIKQYTLDYSPEFSIRRNFSKNKNFTLRYSGNTSQPGVSQLSADTVIYSALARGVGNPGLKMTFRNNMNLNYSSSDFETGRMFSVLGSFSYTFNDIVSNISIDREGNSLSSYRNVDGQMSAYVYASYDKSLRNKKFSVSVNPNLHFSRSIGYNNDEKSTTNSYGLGGQAQMRFSDKTFRNFFCVNVSYRTSDNNLTKQQNINYTVLGIADHASLNLPLGFSISNELNFTYRWGYGPNFKKSTVIWNPSVSKKIMKGGNGMVKIEGFDVLNERNNLTRDENSRGIKESWTSGINRFWMVSFTYRFQLSDFGKRSSKVDIVPEQIFINDGDMVIRGN